MTPADGGTKKRVRVKAFTSRQKNAGQPERVHETASGTGAAKKGLSISPNGQAGTRTKMGWSRGGKRGAEKKGGSRRGMETIKASL